MRDVSRDIPERDLVCAIDEFLDATLMSPHRLGVETVNDGHLVADLRGGRELRRATRERVLAFMARTRDSVVAAVPAEKVA